LASKSDKNQTNLGVIRPIRPTTDLIISMLG
jgi:hypothetical protein